MATKPEYHDAVRGFVKSLKPPMKLSLQALETLAVIAYKQPVTAPEVSEIRGVDSGGVLGGLVSRKLITTAGRKPVIGRPILYKTTKEFLLRFGLKDVNDLPSMEEFEKMAGELAESEAEGEAQDAVMQSTEPLVSVGETTPDAAEPAQEEAEPPAEEPVVEAAAGPAASAEQVLASRGGADES
jgi:segregation and condensation protein B